MPHVLRDERFDGTVSLHDRNTTLTVARDGTVHVQQRCGCGQIHLHVALVEALVDVLTERCRRPARQQWVERTVCAAPALQDD